MTKPQHAIVFAAGLGSRLGTYTQDIPKTLLKFGDATVFDRIIVGLEGIGIRNVTVVTGYLGSTLQHYASTVSSTLTQNKVHLDFIQNDDLDKGNIYSFWLARNKMTEDFILLNSDVVFDYALLESLVGSPHDSLLLVDDYKTLGAEEMKVKLNDARVIKDISKEIEPSTAGGEYIGIMKVSPKTAEIVLEKVELLLGQGKYPLYYEDAFKLVARENDCLVACSTEGLAWTEIDTVEDLHFARNTLLPKLQGILPPHIS
jgi:choline kinase